MSDRLGMVQYGDNDEYVFLGREMARAKVYSESTAEEIDTEVKRIIDHAYRTAQEIITTNRDKLELIAKSLLEYETLDGAQIKELIQYGRLINPPGPPPPPAGAKMQPEKPPKQVVAPDVGPPLPGALGGAPA
jgi:cell division protease FtsH